METCAVTTLEGPLPVVFGLLSDTNRWDRMVGMTASTYTFELADPADPTSRVRVGHCRAGGIPMHFVEEGEYWAPHRLRGERRFRRPGYGRWVPVGFLDVTATPEGAATRVTVRAGVEWRGVVGWLLAVIAVVRMRLVLRRYLAGVAAALARGAGARFDLPPAAEARRALLAIGDAGRHVTGRHGAASAELAVRAARLEQAPVDPEIRRRLVAFVAEQPDEALVQVQPFEVAAAWQADRREVLRAFLHAAKAGLFELEWRIDCPSCRVGAEWAPRLDALGRRVHCEECDIAFDVDFADHVEATFTVAAAVRRVPRLTWCASSPYWRPHVHGYLTIPPRATRTAGPLPDGAVLLRARGSRRQLVVDDGRRPIAVEVTGDEMRAVPPAGDAGLVVTNATDRPVRLFVERAGWSAERVRGSVLAQLPDFLQLFGAEAPATGVQLSVGTATVLFTDLVGSTELYERLGDARAFALVQRHWRACEAIAARHEGAVLKTLGDGLLCSFARLDDAAAAAFEMMDAADEIAREGVGFAIRAAVHEGPCYLVRANDRLDLFGASVNLASRLLGAASGSQLACLASSLAHPGLDAVLADRGAAIHRVETTLRGLRGAYSIAVATRPGAEVMTTGDFAPVLADGARS